MLLKDIKSIEELMAVNPKRLITKNNNVVINEIADNQESTFFSAPKEIIEAFNALLKAVQTSFDHDVIIPLYRTLISWKVGSSYKTYTIPGTRFALQYVNGLLSNISVASKHSHNQYRKLCYVPRNNSDLGDELKPYNINLLISVLINDIKLASPVMLTKEGREVVKVTKASKVDIAALELIGQTAYYKDSAHHELIDNLGDFYMALCNKQELDFQGIMQDF